MIRISFSVAIDKYLLKFIIKEMISFMIEIIASATILKDNATNYVELWQIWKNLAGRNNFSSYW